MIQPSNRTIITGRDIPHVRARLITFIVQLCMFYSLLWSSQLMSVNVLLCVQTKGAERGKWSRKSFTFYLEPSGEGGKGGKGRLVGTKSKKIKNPTLCNELWRVWVEKVEKPCDNQWGCLVLLPSLGQVGPREKPAEFLFLPNICSELALEMSEHPVLYDLTLFAYNNQLKTADAWEKVTLVVGLPGELLTV